MAVAYGHGTVWDRTISSMELVAYGYQVPLGVLLYEASTASTIDSVQRL